MASWHRDIMHRALVAIAAATIVQTAAAQVYRHAAVAADHPVASEAGVEMLRRGGNAVDAAVAASFCLSVVRPYSCGIGGGGFMVIAGPDPDVRVAINYRETAPAAMDRAYFTRLDDEAASHTGPHAVGVPGTVAGLLWALEHHGTLDRGTVLEPAIRVAENGFVADRHHAGQASGVADRLRAMPALRDAAAFVWEVPCRNGLVVEGDLIRNPRQAEALRLIAAEGRDAFYDGRIAAAIVAVMKTFGGPITRQDLADYAVRVSEPLQGNFRGYEIVTMPPPSSGGIAQLQILGLLERRFDDIDGELAYRHLLIEAMKHAFADRAMWLADADFVDVPTRRLLSEEYLDRRAAMISMTRTYDPDYYGEAATTAVDGGTSHLSVIDAGGMAVACTETINLSYGSLVAVPAFGFVLNDEMDDFTTRLDRPNQFELRQSARNLPEPGKRPLSSMSPTIVLAGDRPVIVAGASGGPMIITATVQSVLNCLLLDMQPAEAVGTPRFHHQWRPDVLQFEPRWTDEASVTELKSLGHTTGRGTHEAAVQLIRVSEDGIRAASDPRKGGSPAGY